MFSVEQRIKGQETIRLRSIQKIEAGLYNNKNLFFLRKYLKEKRGNLCEECGIFEWNHKPIDLEVHHIDGNSDNNNLNNVMLMCPNCHSQTDTFKNKNKGSGRKNRKPL
jgi:hypothetical protein